MSGHGACILFRVDVDKLRPELGIKDLLTAVEPEVAREHVGDAAREREVHKLPRAEELDAQHHRRDRAVDRAAEHAHEPERRGKSGRDAEQPAEHAAERGADEKRRHDLAALEPAADGDGGEQQLPEKRVWRGLPALDGAGDDVHAGAVVVPGADKQRQHDHDRAAGSDAQPCVRDAAGKEPLRAVHGHAKEDAHERAHGGERRHAQKQQLRHGRERERKLRRRDAEGVRDRERGERCDDARHERGVIKHAHADDLEREDRCRQRRAEQGREHGAHAAERGDAHVLFIEVEQLPDVAAEAAADLQCGALAPGAAAEQVRDDGRQVDRRHEQQRHLVAEVDGVDDGVGVFVFHFGQAVDGRDEQTAHGQQPQQPRVRGAECRRPVHAQVKGRADQPADAAGHARNDEPLEKRADELPHGARFPFGLFFHIVHGDGFLFVCICAANGREQTYYTTEFAEIPPPYLIFFAGLVIIIRAFVKRVHG